MSSSESRYQSHESGDDDRWPNSSYRRSFPSDRKRRSVANIRHSDQCYRMEPTERRQQYQNRSRSRSQRRSRKIHRRSKRSGSSCNRHCCHRKSKSQFHERELKDRFNSLSSNHSFKQFNHRRIPHNKSEDHRYQQYSPGSSSSDNDIISGCGQRRHNVRTRKKRSDVRKRHSSEIETDSDTSNDDRSIAPQTPILRDMDAQRTISTCTRMTQTEDIITGIAGHHNAPSVRRDTCTGDEYSRIFPNLQYSQSRDVTTPIQVGFSTDSENVDGNVETNIRKVKNDNPGWHCYGTTIDCKICAMVFNSWGHLVKHYLYQHPNYEVFQSRVTPQVADLLRNTAAVHKCQKVKTERSRNGYKQMCYYCNEIKSLERWHWIDHLAEHSGYFKYRCVHCSINLKKESDHVLLANCKVEKAPRTQFEGANLIAYLCDKCNYVRFNRTDIENHMQNEHGGGGKDSFKEVIFLTFFESNFDRTVACNSNGEW